MNKPRRKAASGGWRLHDDRPPTFRGWISTDEGEIGRREWRGRTEIVDVHPLDGSPRPFGDYQVTSSNGSGYTVEIRSLGTHINSCGCRDHRTNRLGTCKHIEGVLHHLRGNRAASPKRRKPKPQESNGRIEIFVDERDDRAVRMTVPEAIERADPAFVQEAARHCRSLRRDSRKAFDALRHMARAHPDRLRCSRSLKTWSDARNAPAGRRFMGPGILPATGGWRRSPSSPVGPESRLMRRMDRPDALSHERNERYSTSAVRPARSWPVTAIEPSTVCRDASSLDPGPLDGRRLPSPSHAFSTIRSRHETLAAKVAISRPAVPGEVPLAIDAFARLVLRAPVRHDCWHLRSRPPGLPACRVPCSPPRRRYRSASVSDVADSP